MKKILYATALMLLSTQGMRAQQRPQRSLIAPINVSASAATVNGSYTTLKAAFDAINSGVHKGVILITIGGNTTESAPALLNASGGAASWTSLTIQPNGSVSVSGAIDGPLIDLNGADNVTFNGAAGKIDTLRIVNSSTGTAAGNAALRLRGVTDNFTLRSCILLASGRGALTSSTGVVVHTGNAGSGLIEDCRIGCDLAVQSSPNKGISFDGGSATAGGTSGQPTWIIRRNQFSDIFSAAAPSGDAAAVYIGAAFNNVSISGNRIYLSQQRSFPAAGTWYGIYYNNANGRASILNNVVGFAGPVDTGVLRINTTNTSLATAFRGVRMVNGVTGTPTEADGNRITAIDFRCARFNFQVPLFVGIEATIASASQPALARVNNNQLGSLDGSTTLRVVNNATSQVGIEIMGIWGSDSLQSFEASGNTIGHFTYDAPPNHPAYMSGIQYRPLNESHDGQINNNTMAYLRHNGTGTSCELTGINATSRCPMTISGNNIHGFRADGAARFSVLTGIYGGRIVTNNTVYNLVTKASFYNPSSNCSVAGIHGLDGSGTPMLWENNRVHSLQCSGSWHNVLYGMVCGYSPLELVVRNNMVALGFDSTGAPLTDTMTIYGLWDDNASPYLRTEYNHNSVYIGGSHRGGSFSFAARASPWSQATFRNNIFVNVRSNAPGSNGTHWGFIDESITGITSSNNVIFANGNGGFSGNYNTFNYLTLAEFAAVSGHDGNSLALDPQFVNPVLGDLHLTGSIPLAVGTAGTGVSVDIDGQQRNATTPWLGADEIPCDAPQLSASIVHACSGVANGSVQLSTQGGSAPFAFRWTGPNSFSATSMNLSGVAPGVYTVVVTATGGCTATRQVTVGTYSGSGMNSVPNEAGCSGSTRSVTFSSPYGNVSYSWTNNNPSIGLPASGTGSIAPFVLQNPGTSTQSATITVHALTPNGCALNPVVFRIQVKPVPTAGAVSSQSICAGTATAPVVFSSNLPGTSFLWTSNNAGIGLPLSGAGPIPSFVGTTVSGVVQTAMLSVTPHNNGCAGNPISFSYTVTPSIASIAYSQATWCPSGTALPQLAGSGGGIWTAQPAGLALNAASGAINLGASAPGSYNIAYTVTAAAGCSAMAATPLTVQPQATVNPIGNQVFCNGVVTAPIPFTGSAASYNWTNDNPSIGLAPGGSGTSLPSFTTVNPGPSARYAYIRVSPVGNGTGNCPGKQIAFRITVAYCPPVTVATGTGEAAARLRADLSLNPNPVVSDQLRVAYSGTSKRLSVEIRDERGVVLLKGLQLSGSNTTLLVGNLRPGTYYVVATDVQSGTQASLPFVRL